MKKSKSLLLVGVVVLVLGYLAYAQLQEGFSASYDASGCPAGQKKYACSTGVKYDDKCYYCSDSTYRLSENGKKCKKTGKSDVSSLNHKLDKCTSGVGGGGA